MLITFCHMLNNKNMQELSIEEQQKNMNCMTTHPSNENYNVSSHCWLENDKNGNTHAKEKGGLN